MRPLTTLKVQAGASVTAGDLRYDDGWAWLNNESSYTLIVSTGSGPQTLPAESSDLFQLKLPSGAPSLIINASAVVPYIGPALISVTGQVYSDTEWAILPPRGPVPLARHAALGSQTRTVAVPIACKQNYLGSFVPNDGATQQFSMSGITPIMQAANSFIAYIYYIEMHLETFGANQLNQANVIIEMYPGDNSLNPIVGFTPIQYFRTTLQAMFNNTAWTLFRDRVIFTPPFPIQGGASGWSGSPTNACIRLRTYTPTGSGMSLRFHLSADVDRNNAQDVPGSIGNAVAYGSTGGANNSDIF